MTRKTLGWLTAALLLRVAANLVVRHLGFAAISDDDYARVVIAQHFARAPAWDPSGTSWLPFPFWLTGTAMVVLGTQLDVAHAVAWCTSLACVPLFWLCANWCGQSERAAGWSACAFAVFPHAVWLDLATVPEGYAAVLALLALTSCNRHSPGERLLGIACINAASLSRYELWPIAALVAVAQVANPPRVMLGASFEKWVLGFASLLGPTSWLIHGAVRHDSALFFVSRVASYRTLVGQGPEHWLDLATNYPKALLWAAPELTVVCLAAVAVAVSVRSGKWESPTSSAVLRYPLLGALATFGFLVWGDARNAAPTHHPERALQVCWLVAILGIGFVLGRAAVGQRSKLAGFVAAALLGLGLGRTNAQSFVNRAKEVALGESFARRLGDAERLLVQTQGYGYTAVAAATGQPWNVVGVNPDDPRQKLDLWVSDDALSGFVAQQRVRWLVVPAARGELAMRFARVVGASDLGLTLERQ